MFLLIMIVVVQNIPTTPINIGYFPTMEACRAAGENSQVVNAKQDKKDFINRQFICVESGDDRTERQNR